MDICLASSYYCNRLTTYRPILRISCYKYIEVYNNLRRCGFLIQVAAPLTRSSLCQIFTVKQIFEKSWEYGKDLFACFVNHEKSYDRVPRDKHWRVLQEYGIDGQLLIAIKCFYCQPEVCVRVNGKQSKPFHWVLVLGKGAFCLVSFS